MESHPQTLPKLLFIQVVHATEINGRKKIIPFCFDETLDMRPYTCEAEGISIHV